MDRRDLLRASIAAVVATGARASSAEPNKPKPGVGVLTVPEYLSRAAILLDETKRAQDWVGGHPGDRGLASMAFDIADLRNQLAAKIAAPPQAKQAHMHLLLALENTAASFDATVRGDDKKAAQRMAAARTEEQTLYLALEGAKLKMPVIK
jgi:hypothetical protein